MWPRRWEGRGACRGLASLGHRKPRRRGSSVGRGATGQSSHHCPPPSCFIPDLICDSFTRTLERAMFEPTAARRHAAGRGCCVCVCVCEWGATRGALRMHQARRVSSHGTRPSRGRHGGVTRGARHARTRTPRRDAAPRASARHGITLYRAQRSTDNTVYDAVTFKAEVFKKS